MKEARFPWVETIHRLGQLPSSGEDLRGHGGSFTNGDGVRLQPPLIFQPHDGVALEPFLKTLPYESGSPKSGRHFFLLVQAGAFAFALWENDRWIFHKTGRRYVIRGTSGRAQSAHNRKRKARSAGAQLRSRNEDALFEDLHHHLGRWKGHYASCDRLFWSIPVRLKGAVFGSAARTADGRVNFDALPASNKGSYCGTWCGETYY